MRRGRHIFLDRYVVLLLPSSLDRDAETDILPADPINVFNSTCGLDDLPHIELPQGYRSLSTQLGGGFRNLGEFTDETYDLRVRQPIPIVLTGRANAEDRQGWSRVLCLAPDDIVPGSRVPEGDFPGGAGRTGAKIWLALVTTLAVAASIT